MTRRPMVLMLLCAAAFAQTKPAEPPVIVGTPLKAGSVYETGERAGWRLELAPGAALGPVEYVLRRNHLDVLRQGKLDLAAGPATVEITLEEPAMVDLEVVLPGRAPARFGAAIAPQRLKPPVARPADFDAFWDGKLKALAEVPVEARLTPQDSGRAGVALWVVELDSLHSKVRGYLAKPAGAGRFPALMMYQWAGVYALNPQSAVDRAAEGWLVFNVSSHDIPVTAKEGVPSDYAAVGAEDRETSYFLNMYLRDARAIDYVRGRADWDGRTIVLLGTSMGGHQSLATAALRPGVTAVLVNEPSGANAQAALFGYQPGYPTWSKGDPRMYETGLYFDTINLASRIEAPVLAAVGFLDTICPPAGIYMALNQLRGPKEVIPMLESDHNNLTPEKQGAWERRHREALEQLRQGLKPF